MARGVFTGGFGGYPKRSVTGWRANEKLLPADYGELVCEGDGSRKVRVGLVVPIFGRSHYVQQALASLAASDLSDCAVCLVDETCSQPFRENIEGFTGFFNVDSPGGDLDSVSEDLGKLAESARQDPGCVAFNSCGWTKRRIALFPRQAPSIKLYVRNDYLARRSWLRKRLEKLSRRSADERTEALVRGFSLGDTPVVKIFKRHHGSMFDSYRRGFQLLIDLFDCSHLVTLDSDTVLKPDWLARLMALHQRFSRRASLVLVTGFHTRAHETLEEGPDYRLKRTAGGINLLFDRRVWEDVVYPSLESLQWDLRVAHRIRESGGVIVASRPSVVDHIGRHGVWSNIFHFDRAQDFWR